MLHFVAPFVTPFRASGPGSVAPRTPRQAPLTYLLASRRTSDGAVMKMDNLLRRADVIKALRNIGDLSVGELKQTGSDLKWLAKDVPTIQR